LALRHAPRPGCLIWRFLPDFGPVLASLAIAAMAGGPGVSNALKLTRSAKYDLVYT
jgi:hypothetical protein